MGTLAPPKRRPILTDLDKELLARLLQQSQTPIEAYTRESALGVPWGSLANSLVGGMLAGRERRRQEEKIKRQDDYADAVTRITSMGTDLMPGQVSISPEGTFQTLPTDAGRGQSLWSSRTPEPNIGYAGTKERGYDLGEHRDITRSFTRADEKGDVFLASDVSPTGIPYAPQPATLTVGEEFPEDSTRLGRWYSGARPQEELSTDANVALSQALRGAGYEPLEYMQYMRNKDKVDISYGKPFTLYGDDGSENIIMSKSDNLGNVQYINSFDQKPFMQNPKVKYSLNKEEIDTTKPYKISFTDGSESVTKSGYVKNGQTYIQWNGKETLVTDIPNVANVEPTSLAKGNTFNIGAKDDEWTKGGKKLAAEKWNNWDNTAYQAQEDINLIDTAMALFAQDSTPEGITAPLKIQAVRLIKAINPSAKVTEASDAQLILSLINEATLASVKRLTGPISEKELKFLQTLQANLGNSKEANAAILLYKKMLARKGANWNNYVATKGGRPDDFKQANAMFREYNAQFNKKYGEGAQGFLNFAKTEAEIEVQALDQLRKDGIINDDEYREKASYIVNNKYQLPYLQNSLGF
jgi:hypothetical protein